MKLFEKKMNWLLLLNKKYNCNKWRRKISPRSLIFIAHTYSLGCFIMTLFYYFVLGMHCLLLPGQKKHADFFQEFWSLSSSPQVTSCFEWNFVKNTKGKCRKIKNKSFFSAEIIFAFPKNIGSKTLNVNIFSLKLIL